MAVNVLLFLWVNDVIIVLLIWSFLLLSKHCFSSVSITVQKLPVFASLDTAVHHMIIFKQETARIINATTNTVKENIKKQRS
jgi:hypothetical protein